MKTYIEVSLNVRMTLEESLELETTLAGAESPTAKALREALRIQNTAASRLVALGGTVAA